METAITFNESGELAGVLHLPIDGGQDRPIVMFINAGFLHHVGPYRLHTLLARRLGGHGYASLRFDLAGLGDSLPGSHVSGESGAGEHDAAIADIGEAIDFLQREHGFKSFVLCGLCSGADDALQAAAENPRVSGAFMIDGPGFRTRRFLINYYFSHYLRRVFSLQKLAHVARRLLSKVDRKADQDVDSFDADFRQDMDEPRLRQIVDSLQRRQCKLHFLYTGGVTDYYNYDAQFADMFGSKVDGDLLSSSYHPQSDHLFFLASHREAASQALEQWLAKSF